MQAVTGFPMALTLYSHPFSSYCQKVLVGLWENGVPFSYRHLEDRGEAEERAAFWPFPVLVDNGHGRGVQHHH
jgi:glutathione S-transferase